MSVALCLDPYEFAEDLGPDDLSDVDLSHPNFIAEFPDGKVPIRYVPQPRAGLGDGFFAWAANVLAIYDACEGYDVDALSAARERIVNYELVGGDKDVTLVKWSMQERKEEIAKLLQAGLTLRQVARYLGWSHADLIEAVTSSEQRPIAESVVLADELIVEAGWSARAAARECGGFDPHVQWRIQALRRPLALVSGTAPPRVDA